MQAPASPLPVRHGPFGQDLLYGRAAHAGYGVIHELRHRVDHSSVVVHGPSTPPARPSAAEGQRSRGQTVRAVRRRAAHVRRSRRRDGAVSPVRRACPARSAGSAPYPRQACVPRTFGDAGGGSGPGSRSIHAQLGMRIEADDATLASTGRLTCARCTAGRVPGRHLEQALRLGTSTRRPRGNAGSGHVGHERWRAPRSGTSQRAGRPRRGDRGTES